MIAVYHDETTGYSPIWKSSVYPTTCLTATTDSTTSTYDWDTNFDDWTWTRPVEIIEPIFILPLPKQWPIPKILKMKDVNILWRKPMRHFYRLHDEKRKGLKR